MKHVNNNHLSRTVLHKTPTFLVCALVVAILVPTALYPQVTSEEGAQEAELTPAAPAAPPATPSQLEEWRDTLRFGINTAVAELLPRLTRERRDELAPDVVDLFNMSNDRAVLQGAAEYLRELEISDGHDRAFDLLREYFARPSELITIVLHYLRETEAEPDEEIREILVEMSRMMPPIRGMAAVRYFSSAGAKIEELLELYHEAGIPEDVQGQILVELGSRGDPRAFEFVAEIIGEDEQATTALQRFAIDTLGRLGDERAIPLILRQLDSSEAMTRAYAVNALTSFDTAETNRALLASLRDPFWRVRIAALRTVGERRMTDAVPAVLYMMRRDPERPVRLEAIRTVGELDDPDAWESLLERMADRRGNVEERSAMIDVALRAASERAVPVVTEIVQHEWDTANSRILDTIGRTVSTMEDRAVAPVVEQLLNHPNYVIQMYGARAAGRNGLRQYSEVLETLKEEGAHRLIRDTAGEALQRLGR